MKLNNNIELEAFRKDYKSFLNNQTKQILVCAGTGCMAGGSLNIYDKFAEILSEKGIKADLKLEKHVEKDKVIGLKKSGCHGFCEMGPLVRIEPSGNLYIKVKPSFFLL